MSKTNPVVHFEMPATDGKRMSEFYTNAFGWKDTAFWTGNGKIRFHNNFEDGEDMFLNTQEQLTEASIIKQKKWIPTSFSCYLCR